jgi:hypothetical protein
MHRKTSAVATIVAATLQDNDLHAIALYPAPGSRFSLESMALEEMAEFRVAELLNTFTDLRHLDQPLLSKSHGLFDLCFSSIDYCGWFLQYQFQD